MCFKKDPQTPKAKSPRSPWRHNKQLAKPRLSRKIVRSAKVNLNRYWSKFEEMASQTPVMAMTPDLAAADNEINDNLLNERREER